MRNSLRFLLIFCLFAATALPCARAAGLGEALLRSALLEPLRLEIALLGEDAASLDASCFRIQRAASGADDLPWITDAQIRVQRRSDGARLIVTTRHRLEHPAMMIGITADCDARLHREYPLLLSPPSASPSPSAQTAEGAQDHEAAAPARRTARPTPPRATASRHADQGSRRPIERRAEAYPAPRREHEPALAQTQSFANEKRDRLLVRSGEPGTPSPTGETEKTSAAQSGKEQELIARVDEKISRLIEMEEKIRQLEALSRRLDAENKRMQILLDKPLAPQPSQPSGDYLALPWLLLYALALISVTAILWLWRKKRADELDTVIEPEYVQPDEFEPAPDLDLGPETLSTADVWPDQSAPAAAAIESDEDWGLPQASAPPGPSSQISIDESIEEHDSAVELAEIMMSFGRIQGAAETLAEYIRTNPRQAVRPWVKLLEVYKAANLRAEFDALALKLNQTFNVIAVNWEEFDKVKQINDSIEQMPHILQTLTRIWNTREAQAYLYKLLRDNRDGTRRGFPLGPLDDLLMLSGVLEIELGAFHPTEEEQAQMFAPPEPQAGAQKPEAKPPARPETMLDLAFEEVAAPPPLPEIPQQGTVTVVEFNLDEDIPPLPGKH
ncbi:FimV family protein [Niveibacterium terrae]|uniref:type IV pilus assembly protein FimV n=1 Tax=Niveibacterium terrae TaxID=3373598 RepID=UPI003A94909A